VPKAAGVAVPENAWSRKLENPRCARAVHPGESVRKISAIPVSPITINKEFTMDLLDLSEKRVMQREEAAALLRKLADSLARHNELTFERDGKTLRIDVPDHVEVELELEIEDDESSLEIEISW
jgi:amphi-Trp domain-containing protein